MYFGVLQEKDGMLSKLRFILAWVMGKWLDFGGAFGIGTSPLGTSFPFSIFITYILVSCVPNS